MKTQKVASLILVCLLVFGMFAGCNQKAPAPSVQTPSQSENLPAEKPATSTSSTVSVGELKNKYGESDAGKLLPMYNLDPHEPLVISLKYTPTNIKDVFSVHTDEKCLEASEVALMVSPSDYSSTGPKSYEVWPIMAPLSNSDTECLWGGVSNYFIKFNYDISAETETKLDKPVIVAFSIQSSAAIPNIGYTLENGCFTLTWTAVEGATAYRIYQRRVFGDLLVDSNIAPSGKEEAYSGEWPLLKKEVSADTLSFNDWLDTGEGGKTLTSTGDANLPYLIGHQNQGVNGEYYVTAVVDGKESLFSMGVNTANLDLPAEIDDEASFTFFDTPADLPMSVAVRYVDGSVKPHRVFYESIGGDEVKYTVENTDLVGCVYVRENAEHVQPDPQAQEPDSNSGFVAPENTTEQNAPADVPTINDGKGVPEEPVETPTTPTEPSGDTTEPSEPPAEHQEPEKTITEQQVENTEKVLEEANQETVETPEGITVTASSAAEEYLAWALVAGKAEISLAAFPELQNWAVLTDVLNEVVYQNPMILGVRSYAYNYVTMTLAVEYDYSVEEMRQRQDEILAEGKKIIGSIITSDMDDAAKRRAIYDYLEANTTYDDAACGNAMENNFQGMDNNYRDSFSTYGILVKKVGVCQSYAYAFDYLCELAGVNCIVVTGDIMGYLPHAWNKVEVDGEWLSIDVTNNEKSLGVEDFMYENPDALAYAMGYIEDDLYYTVDDDVYHSSNTALSRYKDCIIASTDELDTFIHKNANVGSTVEFLATYEGFESDDVISALAKAGIKELGNSIVIYGYVWFEVAA